VVKCFAVSGTNLFVGTDDSGVFLSINSGSTWTAVNTGLRNHYINSLAVSPNGTSGTNLFAGTNGDGVFLSTNGGLNWTAVNTGLTNSSVSAFAVRGTNLFVGTVGAGVWRRPLSEMVTSMSTSSGDIPNEFKVEQNYPNPFNPATTIRYGLPQRSNVVLTVYNTLGQEVSTLVQRQQEAGSYEVKFDGSALASGVYFYRLQTGSFVDTKKLLLLR